VTNFDELTRFAKAGADTKDISGGSGRTVFFTVPIGKSWYLTFVSRSGTTANSNVVLVIGGVAVQISPASTSFLSLSLNRIKMSEGDTVNLTNTGNGADTARGCFITYEEEDAF